MRIFWAFMSEVRKIDAHRTFHLIYLIYLLTYRVDELPYNILIMEAHNNNI